MSKLQILYICHEVALDDSGHCIEEYEKDLPHHDMIAKEMCKSFNNMHIERFFDGILKDNIKSATMKFKKVNNESIAVITIEGVPNFRFSEPRRNQIFEQMDGQLSDGWGETFFGFGNIMQDKDGNHFCVE